MIFGKDRSLGYDVTHADDLFFRETAAPIRKNRLHSTASAKVEYLYITLDAPSHTALPLAANPPFALRHNVGDIDLNIVRFGLN